MIETRRLKNVVIFVQTILSFVLSRKIINIYNDIARKYGNVTVKDFRKYEKLEYKKNKLKLAIFLATKHPGKPEKTNMAHSYLNFSMQKIHKNSKKWWLW